MSAPLRFLSFLLLSGFFALLLASSLSAQDSKIMGELRFQGATSVARDSGVWIDGNYVGYVKELKDDKKVLLLPGKHQITVRNSGYSDWTSNIIVEPGQIQTLHIKMSLLPNAQEPKVTSQLKLTIHPPRAAVFVDGNYVGHAGELGGAVHALLISPGKHHIKVELPGYRTFETEVTLLAGQKSEVKTELVKGSVELGSAEIKTPPTA